MTLVECPRCRIRVLTRPDGTCPNCHKKPEDTAGIDLDKVALTIRPSTRLPAVCFVCGQTADRTRRIRRTREFGHKAEDPTATITLLLFGLLGALVWVFRDRAILRAFVDLPVCSRCKRVKPEVDYIDWDRAEITVVCHRRLRDESMRISDNGRMPAC